MSTRSQFGLTETERALPGWCTNDGCQASVIAPGAERFIEDDSGRTYCVPCGQRLRYHRKKADERGEELPRSFEDVDQRHAGARPDG
jgi:hypothetical protein